MAYGVSSIDNSELLLGRPYDGVGIIWHKKWSKYESNRVCAIAIENVPQPFYIVCCYLPCDSNSAIAVSDEFLQAMDAIEYLRAETALCYDFRR